MEARVGASWRRSGNAHVGTAKYWNIGARFLLRMVLLRFGIWPGGGVDSEPPANPVVGGRLAAGDTPSEKADLHAGDGGNANQLLHQDRHREREFRRARIASGGTLESCFEQLSHGKRRLDAIRGRARLDLEFGHHPLADNRLDELLATFALQVA